MTHAQMLLLVCPLIFLASFIDSIAGGGGLISLPAYLATGIPAHMAFGSNKLSAGCGSLFAMFRYYKSGKIHVKAAAVSAALALLGSAAGARLNLLIDADVLKKVMLFVLPVVAVVVLFVQKKGAGKPLMQGGKLYAVCALIGFFIGLYDGLLGPGTGTFMILAYTMLAGFDYVTASGNAKVANLASNVASVVVYIVSGKVLYWLALPAAACSIVGGWVGSSFAVKKGTGFIKVILVVVLVGIFGKLIFDLYLA